MEQKIIDAVKRFETIVNSLECECDEYHGYTCTIHADRILAKEALAIIASQPENSADGSIAGDEETFNDSAGW
jgi:hypothetical protein